MRSLIAEISHATKFTPEQILGHSTHRPLCKTRWAIRRAASRKWGMSQPKIAEELNRDASTIFHGLQRGSALYEADPAFKIMCDWLEAKA